MGLGNLIFSQKDMAQAAEQARAAADQVTDHAAGELEAIEAKAAADVRSVLDSLDGWTLEVTVPWLAKPICTIRLNKPKGAR